MKYILSVIFICFISTTSFSQSKKIGKKNSADSVSLAKYLKKIRTELLTQTVINKYKSDTSLKTLTIIYGTHAILTTAKND